MLTIDTDEIVVGYPTMFELMEDLKGMGEGNAAFNRPLHISRDTLMSAAAIYKELYGKPEGISATFQVRYNDTMSVVWSEFSISANVSDNLLCRMETRTKSAETIGTRQWECVTERFG